MIRITLDVPTDDNTRSVAEWITKTKHESHVSCPYNWNLIKIKTEKIEQFSTWESRGV